MRRWIRVIGAVVVAVGAGMAVWTYLRNEVVSVPGSAMFPTPTTESGTGGFLMRFYHGLSENPRPETSRERHLAYNDFDPLPLATACLYKSNVPANLGSQFLKKTVWWPEVSMYSQAVRRRDAAAVVRYEVPGWTIQLTASRGRNVFMAQNTDQRADWTPDETILGLPKCFGQVFERALFDKPKASYAKRESYRLVDGSTLEHYEGIDLDVQPPLKGAPFYGSASWLGNIMVLGVTPMEHVPAWSGPKPLFVPSASATTRGSTTRGSAL